MDDTPVPTPRRPFGASGVELSALGFGVMRLAEKGFDADTAADFVTRLYDRGVTTFHVSHEYESHALACAALRGLRRRRPGARIEVVAKLAAPHFDQTGFDGRHAEGLIEALRRDLDVERIDLVQWMVRHTPNTDAPRLAILARDADRAGAVWAGLRQAGRIGALGVFPYSDAFAQAALDLPWVDGIVTYLNLEETEAAAYLDRLWTEGRGFVAIRPLNGGRLAANVRNAIRFPLLHPAVASTLLSVSTQAQAAEAIDAARQAVPDREAFQAALAPQSV